MALASVQLQPIGISHFSVVREVLTWGCGDAKTWLKEWKGESWVSSPF